MKDTLQEINALREAGIIGQSAIGGAMGATFYLEPISTYDLDIFILFDSPPLILTLTPIYDFLRARGHEPEGDAVSVCGWPVQFLPAESPLLKEAVEQAVTVDFEGVPTRVMTAGIWPPSPCKRAGRRTSPACWPLWSPARWRRTSSRTSWPGINWQMHGANLKRSI